MLVAVVPLPKVYVAFGQNFVKPDEISAGYFASPEVMPGVYIIVLESGREIWLRGDDTKAAIAWFRARSL